MRIEFEKRRTLGFAFCRHGTTDMFLIGELIPWYTTEQQEDLNRATGASLRHIDSLGGYGNLVCAVA